MFQNSKAALAFAGLTVMMLTMAFLGPWTGRMIARHGAANRGRWRLGDQRHH